MNAEQMALVRESLDQLGEPCREIIELRYFGDLSYEELSASSKMNPKTVSSRLSKCLDRLEEIARKMFSREKPDLFPSNLTEQMEPERKIEKLLRAYAKKRRAQAGDPLKLHPATRRLLQDEIARNAPQARTKKMSPCRSGNCFAGSGRFSWVSRSLFFSATMSAAVLEPCEMQGATGQRPGTIS